jgi:hypothetical protein
MTTHSQKDFMSAPTSNFAESKTMLTVMAAEIEELKCAVGGSITDVAAGWITTQYLQAVRQQLAKLPEGAERLKLLRQATGDLVAFQRGGHSAARLQLDRDKFEFLQKKHRDALAAAQSKIQKSRDPKLPLSDEDRRAIVDKADEIMGLK